MIRATQPRRTISFVVLAYTLSWLAWSPLWLSALGILAIRPSPYWHLVGGLGPLVAAVVVSATEPGTLARLVARTVRVRGHLWWIIGAALGPIGLAVVALAFIDLVGGRVSWCSLGHGAEFPWLALPFYWLANVVCYGFGEEVGWRGFLLPRLQRRRSALTASLLVAAIWAGWHLPLFAFSPGLSAMGAGGLIGWTISILTGSVITAWLFNASGGSVLAVALFHGVLDIVMMSPAHPMLPTVMGVALTVAGFVLPWLVGRKNLGRRPRVIPSHRCRLDQCADLPHAARRAIRHGPGVEAIAEGVWQIRGPSLRFTAGVLVPSRSTVLRLHGGELLIYSPIAEMPGVDEVGTVAHVVEPNRLHHLFVGAARERWPAAAVHHRELALQDAAIDAVHVDGVPKLDETVVFHRPSGTLVVADLVFNMTAENLRSRLAFAITGVGGNRVAQSREWKWARKDTAAARASVERVLAWPIQRVAFCHGESVAIDPAGLAAVMRI